MFEMLPHHRLGWTVWKYEVATTVGVEEYEAVNMGGVGSMSFYRGRSSATRPSPHGVSFTGVQ
jgi:hypothetical protein